MKKYLVFVTLGLCLLLVGCREKTKKGYPNIDEYTTESTEAETDFLKVTIVGNEREVATASNADAEIATELDAVNNR